MSRTEEIDEGGWPLRPRFTAPDGSTNTYGHDTLGRLNTLTDSGAGQFTFSYDALSRRTGLNRPNGVNTTYGYDSVSRLLNLLHQAGTTTLDGAGYTYDNAGNRTSKNNYLNNTTENYTYDPLYQLTQVAQGTTTTESYSYDPVGNRLSSLGMSPYAYNSSNQLTSTPAATFTYDGNGNTLTKADSSGTTTYTWNFENQLTSVALPETSGTVTFKYDPFGRRIQKSSASGTTNYLYDGSNSVAEVDASGTLLARYAQGAVIDEPLAEVRSGTAEYYEADGLGSVTSLSDSTSSLANTYTYDAFGNVAASTGVFTNPFQYTARDTDSDTGLRYYRARYYDPAIGRFINEDPAHFDGGDNFYAYTINNPVNYVDPMGLLAQLWCEGIGASRGGSRNAAILFLANPVHCYLYVECHGKGVYVELYGPPRNPDGTFGKHGIPHNDNPFNADRAAHSKQYPIHPPAGSKCCEFEDKIMAAFAGISANLPDYSATGPNSNTFVADLINQAGGWGDFPSNAYGWHDHIMGPTPGEALVPHRWGGTR